MTILWLALLTFVASLLGTLAGFGSSTIMIPIVAMFFPLPVTLLFVAVVHFFNDLWEIILFKHKVDRKLLLSFAIPGVITSVIGARLVLNIDTSILSQILGVFLVGYVVFIHLDPKFKVPEKIITATSGGGISGIVAGIFGISGPIQGLLLSTYGLPKAVYISTLGAIAMVVDVARIVTYITGGVRIDKPLLWGLVVFIPLSFIAAEIAKKFIDKIPQKKFREVISAFLLIIGIRLILSPL